MNNLVYLLVFKHIFTGILIFKGLTARRFYKSFGVKGLISDAVYGLPLCPNIGNDHVSEVFPLPSVIQTLF
jgi:hypothetical protein